MSESQEEYIKSLKEWQKEKLQTFQCYVDNRVWSIAEFEVQKKRVLNPPQYFIDQFKDVEK